MDVLVTYDIAGTEETAGATRLRRVAQICEKYGQRVQFSVFECRLSPERLARLIGEVQGIIDSHRDSVIVYRFPGQLQDAKLRFGRNQDRELGQPWLL